MKILVCGGRYYNDKARVFAVLDIFHKHCQITEIIHGAATGADTFAGDWAEERGIPQQRFPIKKEDWTKFGKRAGRLRNEKMLKEAFPDLVIAFPGGTGTAHMCEISDYAGLQVIQIP